MERDTAWPRALGLSPRLPKRDAGASTIVGSKRATMTAPASFLGARSKAQVELVVQRPCLSAARRYGRRRMAGCLASCLATS